MYDTFGSSIGDIKLDFNQFFQQSIKLDLNQLFQQSRTQDALSFHWDAVSGN